MVYGHSLMLHLGLKAGAACFLTLQQFRRNCLDRDRSAEDRNRDVLIGEETLFMPMSCIRAESHSMLSSVLQPSARL